MKNQTITSRLTVVFSGAALAFVVIAAHSATDQGQDAGFEREKLAYIRQYALPKRMTSSDQEVLFGKREAGKPVASPGRDQTPATTKESSPEAPPPSEGQ